MTKDEQAAYEAEADAYFDALDYAFAKHAPAPPLPAPLPMARTHRLPWWRRLFGEGVQ